MQEACTGQHQWTKNTAQPVSLGICFQAAEALRPALPGGSTEASILPELITKDLARQLWGPDSRFVRTLQRQWF